jgi:5-methylcytosine-specific restriction endonuclease McrA
MERGCQRETIARHGRHEVIAQTSGLACNVLVLNRNYLAIRVINVKRAFSLLFREMAEVIHLEDGKYASYHFSEWCELSELAREFEPDAHDWIRTVRFDIAVPRIIRLAIYDRLPQQSVKFNRRNIYARDGNRCQYCGRKFPTTDLSLDHVVPRSLGGKTSWENIVCACLQCNIRKGGRTPEVAGMHLIAAPKKPRRNPVLTIKLADGRYASWKAFLDNAYWSVELK